MTVPKNSRNSKNVNASASKKTKKRKVFKIFDFNFYKMEYKNKKNIMFFSVLAILVILFIVLSLSSFVLAQQRATTLGDIGRAIGNWIKAAFGFTELGVRADWRFVAIVFVIFIMFFFAFSDIIYSFTAFSKTTSYILGFGLAVIAALTKGVFYIAWFVMSGVAALGAFSVALVIILAFLMVIALHLSLFKFLRKKKSEKEIIEYASKIRRGAKFLEEVEKGVKKKSS